MKRNRGMTLFISIVIMGLLLLISFAVVSITLKGTLFATSGRDSQYAFYAADSGIECAIYWDSKFEPSKFATTTPGIISCAGQTIFGDSQDVPTNPSQRSFVGGGGDIKPTSIFYFHMNQGLNPVLSCVIVTVEKRASDNKTYIKSKGYNTCDITNPRRVERGVEVNY